MMSQNSKPEELETLQNTSFCNKAMGGCGFPIKKCKCVGGAKLSESKDGEAVSVTKAHQHSTSQFLNVLMNADNVEPTSSEAKLQPKFDVDIVSDVLKNKCNIDIDLEQGLLLITADTKQLTAEQKENLVAFFAFIEEMFVDLKKAKNLSKEENFVAVKHDHKEHPLSLSLKIADPVLFKSFLLAIEMQLNNQFSFAPYFKKAPVQVMDSATQQSPYQTPSPFDSMYRGPLPPGCKDPR